MTAVLTLQHLDSLEVSSNNSGEHDVIEHSHRGRDDHDHDSHSYPGHDRRGAPVPSSRGFAGKKVQEPTHIHLWHVSRVVLLMFIVTVIEVMVWACAYLLLNAIEGFEKAAYFSMVTFTTLGYGEIVLDERWRLLASFEAANGIIMFGWTTALVIGVVQRVYFNE